MADPTTAQNSGYTSPQLPLHFFLVKLISDQLWWSHIPHSTAICHSVETIPQRLVLFTYIYVRI